MAKAKGKKKAKKKVVKAKKKGKAGGAAKPKRKPVAKRKKVTAKPKRKAPAKKGPAPAAARETARLREEANRWQQLHAQLQEQIRAKDSTISLQMQEIMELRKRVEELQSPM